MESVEPKTRSALPIVLVAVVVVLIGAGALLCVKASSFVHQANEDASHSIASQITKPGDDSLAIEVQSDVKATVINATTYFMTDPSANPSGVQVVSSGKDTVQVTTDGAGNFVVTGHDPKTNYTYTYYSANGQYVSSN